MDEGKYGLKSSAWLRQECRRRGLPLASTLRQWMIRVLMGDDEKKEQS